jgi:hypothetical protein
MIGRSGRSVTFKAGSAANIISILPGGGGSNKLAYGGDLTVDGSALSSTFKNNYLSKQGRINNNLFSQTLTLSMNARLNSNKLAGFVLQNGWLVTQENSGCGENATVVDCTTDPGALKSWQMVKSVIDYLEAHGGATVSSLLDLANDVLGGVKTPGVDGVPSYADITNQVDIMNNAFDGCRTSNSYSPTAVSCPPLDVITLSTARRNIEISEPSVNDLKVAAYPNPYTDAVKFTIQSNVSGQAQLEVVNMLGQKIATVYNGYIQANRSQVVEYKVPAPAQQNLIYILRIGSKQVTGKLLKGNR